MRVNGRHQYIKHSGTSQKKITQEGLGTMPLVGRSLRSKTLTVNGGVFGYEGPPKIDKERPRCPTAYDPSAH